MKQPARLAAADKARGSTSSNRGKGHRAAAFAGALALLAAGGIAATFLVGGEQTTASATDAPQMGLAAAAQQLPVRTVKTITIRANQKAVAATSRPKPVAVAPAPADAEAPLPPEDPRWARAAAAPASQPIPVNTPVDLTPPAMGAALSALAAAAEPSDPLTTAAIFRNGEQVLARQDPAQPAEPLANTPDEPAAAPTQTVRVNDGVNLRARPVSGSRVLRTIPARAAVGLVGCKAWCEVVYQGTRGFVYKSFIGQARAAAKEAPASAEAAQAATGQTDPNAAQATPNTAEAAKASNWLTLRDR